MKISKKVKRSIFSALQLAFVFLLTIGVSGYFASIGVDDHHDGFILKAASDVARGQMLFRDTFTQYGALSTLIQAVAIRLFGNYLLVLNLLTAFFYGLIAVMLWLIWSFFIPELYATISCVIWLFLAPYFDYIFLPWPSVYSLFFQLVTLYFLLRFIKSKKNVWQLIAGVAAALTFWTRQPVGFLLVGSIIFYFVILRLKKYKMISVIPFFISFMVTNAIFFAWLVMNNAVSDWFFQTVQEPAKWVAMSSPGILVSVMTFLSNMFANSHSPLSIWTIMPLICVYLVISVVIKKKINVAQSSILLVASVNLASWLQYHPVNDIRHLYWAAAPMIGFVFYIALNRKDYKKNGLIFLLICLLLFFPDVFTNVRLARRKIRQFMLYPTLTKPTILKGMRVPPGEKHFFDEAMKELITFKKIHPRSFITSVGNSALYSLFDGGNKNCYKLTVDWDWKRYDVRVTKEYSQAMKSCITTHKPAVFTQDGYYHPEGYRIATKNKAQTGNYLLLPND